MSFPVGGHKRPGLKHWPKRPPSLSLLKTSIRIASSPSKLLRLFRQGITSKQRFSGLFWMYEPALVAREAQSQTPKRQSSFRAKRGTSQWIMDVRNTFNSPNTQSVGEGSFASLRMTASTYVSFFDHHRRVLID